MTLSRYTDLPGKPPRVTSIISEMVRSPGLEYWKTTEAVRAGMRSTTIEDGRALLGSERDDTMGRGSAVHAWVADMFEAGVVLEPPLAVRSFCAQFLDWRDRWPSTVVSYEEVVISPSPPYAGRYDMVLLDGGGGKWLVDVKTAAKSPRGIYPEHALQLAAYGRLLDVQHWGILQLWPAGWRLTEVERSLHLEVVFCDLARSAVALDELGDRIETKVIG